MAPPEAIASLTDPAPGAGSSPPDGAPRGSAPARSETRIRPLVAWRALRRLFRDPDDTKQVFVIVGALSGRSGERSFLRFRADPNGARILRERRSLLATLSDRAALERLPEGSLGRTYAEFMGREQISAGGLAEASQEGGRRLDFGEERRIFANRLRDMHDLWHVVTGYGRDLVGEAALLSFSYAQSRNRGIGFIVGMAWWRAGRDPEGRAFRRLVEEGYRRGRDAAWLPAADWEALLARPLDEVRATLRVGEPRAYRAVRSAGAPAEAA